MTDYPSLPLIEGPRRGRSPEYRANRDAVVLSLRSRGFSCYEIALQLQISDRTVRRIIQANRAAKRDGN